jgi:hypothetical protein
MAGAGSRERLAKLVQLGLAADEPREPAHGRRVEPRAEHPHPGQFVHVHRDVQSLHRHRPERLDLYVAFGQPQRIRGQERAPGVRELLHPGGEVCGLPDRGVVHVEVAADRPHHDLARVEPDPDLDTADAVDAPGLLRVLSNRRLHVERRVARPHGVVLMRQRGAEERHDPVAHDLVDRPLVAVNGLHHALEHGDRGACGPLPGSDRPAAPSSP